MAPACGEIQPGRVRSGIPLSPVVAVGSGLRLSDSPICLKNATAFIGLLFHLVARFSCPVVGVYWPGLKYFGRCPRASNWRRGVIANRSTTLWRIDVTEAGSLAGTRDRKSVV